MWERYVTEGIMPFCAGHPAALIADSHSPHISDLSVSLAADYNISCIQSPPGTTAALQPNDVGEDGGLNRKSKADYLDKIRSHIGRPTVETMHSLAISAAGGGWTETGSERLGWTPTHFCGKRCPRDDVRVVEHALLCHCAVSQLASSLFADRGDGDLLP
jgi:hypothetical protein